MVLLENDGFLSELTRMFEKSKSSGSVTLTMKKYNGKVKPTPRKSKVEKGDSAFDPEVNKCLVRATVGRKKRISTVISSKDVTKFQMAYANLLKANMDALKKRDKKAEKSKKKTKAGH
eukprot:m.308609 g.308609  ORF g.308609 m.308609 type:complete len:118 (+) comp44374_c0_seq1:161-514(+)